MTCYRVGWVAGDKRIVDIFKKVKTNIDSVRQRLYKMEPLPPSAMKPMSKRCGLSIKSKGIYW